MNEVTYYFCFQYLRLARTLRHYGYMQFSPAITDYPHPNCPVLIAAGNKELNFRIQVSKVIQSSRHERVIKNDCSYFSNKICVMGANKNPVNARPMELGKLAVF